MMIVIVMMAQKENITHFWAMVINKEGESKMVLKYRGGGSQDLRRDLFFKHTSCYSS